MDNVQNPHEKGVSPGSQKLCVEMEEVLFRELFLFFTMGVPPLRGGPGYNLILNLRLAGAGAYFSREGKVPKARLGNYVS